MALYGQLPYGTFTYGAAPVADRVVSSLTARRGIEGPQIILEWTKPTAASVTKVRIVRKMGSYPNNETDGKNVYESAVLTQEYYTDFPGYGPEFYYYKIFSEVGMAWFSNRLAETVELGIDTQSEKQDKYFRELPEIYRVFDKARYGAKQVALAPAWLDIKEKILLAEDGVTDQGELRRFLKLFNLFHNEILALLRAIATRDGISILHDVKRTAPRFLSYISKLYGWEFNWDLPVNAARAEVVSLPETYSKKGRLDQTTAFINNILSGHTVTIIPMDEVIDMNGYPNGFIDTRNLLDEINFLTALNSIYVIADLTGTSSIGFNDVAINIVPNSSLQIKASQIKKLENIVDDFFNILDDVYIIIHQTFNLNYPADITTAGQTFLSTWFPLPNPLLLAAFGHFAIGSGILDWDAGTIPPVSPGDTALVNEVFRDLPRNVVFLDGSDNPTLTATKKVLLRCFMDLNTFNTLYSRESGVFGNDSTGTPNSGTLLAEKRFPIRFIDDRVRYVVDFKIQFP